MKLQRKVYVYPIIALVLCMTVAAWAEGVEAITMPSKDVTLSFIQPGRVEEILVKPGDSVKAGDVLVRLDDAVERKSLEILKAKADDEIRIKAAQARLELKKKTLDSLRKAGDAVSEKELMEAELDVKINTLSMALEQLTRAQDKREYDKAALQISRMTLRSPIDGKVERIHVEAGESVNTLAEVIRVVNINPLKMEVPAPRSMVAGIKPGQSATVNFRRDGVVPPRSVEGEITHVDSVADAASNTLRVIVEVDNSTGRPAGEHVTVTFRSSSAEATSNKGRTAATGKRDVNSRKVATARKLSNNRE